MKYQITPEQYSEAESLISTLNEMLVPTANTAIKVKFCRLWILLAAAELAEIPEDEHEADQKCRAIKTWNLFAHLYPTVPVALMPALFERNYKRLRATLSGEALEKAATLAFENECRNYPPPSLPAGSFGEPVDPQR